MTEPGEAWTLEQHRLLLELLVGGRDERDPEAVAAMADPAFRAELLRLRQLQQRLDEAGSAERAANEAAAARGEWHPMVAATIARLAGVPEAVLAPSRPLRRRSWWIGLAAGLAAAALVLLWRLLDGDGRRPDDDRVLGSEPLTLVQPVATGTGGLQLQWRSTLAGASFAVVVYDPDLPEDPPLVSETVPATTWILEPELVARLRPGMRWRVTALVPGRRIERDGPLR